MLGTAERLRREAEAMDRLARIVSYGPDKVRLSGQAEKFREQARAIDGRVPVAPLDR